MEINGSEKNKLSKFQELEGIFHLLGMIFGCDYIIFCFRNIYKEEYVEDILPINSRNEEALLKAEEIDFVFLRQSIEVQPARILDLSEMESMGINDNYSVMVCTMNNSSFIKGALAVVSTESNAWSRKDTEKLNKMIHMVSEYNSLKEYKQYTDTIIESIDTAIFAVSTLGNLVTFNRAAERILGCSSEGVIGKHYFELMAYKEREKMRLSVDYVIRTGNTYRGNFVEMTRRDNKIIYTNILVCPWISNSGEIIGAIAVVTDETENKLFQDKLIRSEKLAILEQVAAQVSPENDELIALVNRVMNGVDTSGNYFLNEWCHKYYITNTNFLNAFHMLIPKDYLSRYDFPFRLL